MNNKTYSILAILAICFLSSSLNFAAHGQCSESILKHADQLIKYGYVDEGMKIYFDQLGACKKDIVLKRIEKVLKQGSVSVKDSIIICTINQRIKNEDFDTALTLASELIKESNSVHHRLVAAKLTDSLGILIAKQKQTKDSIYFLIGDSYLYADNYEKAIEYYEKYELPKNRFLAQKKIAEAVGHSEILNNLWSDFKTFATYVIEVIVGIFIIWFLFLLFRVGFKKVNEKKIEIIEKNDGLDTYTERFKFLFKVKNEEIHQTANEPIAIPVFQPGLVSTAPQITIHDDGTIGEFFTAIDGVKYASILKWIMTTVNKSRYSLQYSFKVLGDNAGAQQVSFFACLYDGKKMLDTLFKQFPESNLVVEEENLAHELAAMVYRNINENG